MNIIKLLSENLPEGVTLTDKQLAAIEKEIKREIGEETVPKESYSKKTKALDAAEAKIAELEVTAGELKAAKDELATERKAHADTKTAHEAEQTAAALDRDVAKLLEAAGMHGKVISKALKDYDRAKVERDADGKIKDSEKLVEAFKSEWGDFFGEVTTTGADVGTPPAGAPAKVTAEQFKKMGYNERNALYQSDKAHYDKLKGEVK